MIEFELVGDGESSIARAAKKWSPELPPASFTAVAHDGGLRDHATVHYEMQLGFPRTRMLTVGLAEDSKSTIMAGDELTVADSGDHLRRRTAQILPATAPAGQFHAPG
jgi:hypothetical protein